MPDDQDTPRGRRFLGTDRLAAFSDGAFSIAATLLVLVLPEAAVVLYCGIAVYLIVPFREVARLLPRRS